MATRTFRGTINSDWQTAGNWLEGAVPVAGDDVVFDDLSPNCTLSANAPASGRLNSLICTNYTNTLNLNGYTMYVGQGALNGVIFDGGSSCNFTGNGTLQFYSTTTTSTGYNIIIASNPNLQNVDMSFLSNANGRYFYLSGDFYCKNMYSDIYGILFNGNGAIYIYGDIISYINPITRSYNGYFFAASITSINIMNNCNIDINNGLFHFACLCLNIYNTLTLSKNIQIQISNTNTRITLIGNGNIACNNNILQILANTPSSNIYIDFNNTTIESLIIYYAYLTYVPIVRFVNNFTVTKLFNFFSVSDTNGTSNHLTLRSNTNGQKVQINIGNECNYLISHVNLYDISFNKPVKGFYCSYNNCDNITSGEYPEICVNVY